jgi:L-fuculose-phosphate aldolase
MILADERQAVVDGGLALLKAGLVTGTSGNLSCMRPQRDLIAVSPSGLAYPDMRPADVVVVDLAGQHVDGRLAPSSELELHLALYRRRPEALAVVHTHSVYATTLACLGWEIPAVHYLVGFAGRRVPLAPYATFGTPELAAAVAATMGTAQRAVLMAHHGLVAIGRDLAAALNTAEAVEFVARIYCQARSLGQPAVIDDAEMDRVMERFGRYGQSRPADA